MANASIHFHLYDNGDELAVRHIFAHDTTDEEGEPTPLSRRGLIHVRLGAQDAEITLSGTPTDIANCLSAALQAVADFVETQRREREAAGPCPAGGEHRFVYLTAYDMGPEPFTTGWYCEECMAPAPVAVTA